MSMICWCPCACARRADGKTDPDGLCRACKDGRHTFVHYPARQKRLLELHISCAIQLAELLDE